MIKKVQAIKILEPISIPINNAEVLIQEICFFSDLFIKANTELKKVKESSEILDLNRLKLIFGEVNIKKEGIIAKIFEISTDEYNEVETFLSLKFSQTSGIEKRAFAELKAGIINAKNENLSFNLHVLP